jgi:hypothetical protein
MSKPIPILLFAYNRPQTLSELLQSLNSIPNRTIHISIDGPKLNDIDDRNRVESVKQVVLDWQTKTSHEICLIMHDKNLGIFEHFKKATYNFFSLHNFGLILEDDIRLSPSFISFLDEQSCEIFGLGYGFISGHNPVNHQLDVFPESEPVTFFPSRVLTIWGWATTSNVIFNFHEIVQTVPPANIPQLLIRASRNYSSSYLVRNSFVNVWLRKLWRAINLQGGGWDNLMLMSIFSAETIGLVPTRSLSGETEKFGEGQTHPHNNLKEFDWHEKSIDTIESPKTFEFPRVNHEESLLSVWGISRKYAFFYALRIFRQKLTFIRKFSEYFK